MPGEVIVAVAAQIARCSQMSGCTKTYRHLRRWWSGSGSAPLICIKDVASTANLPRGT